MEGPKLLLDLMHRSASADRRRSALVLLNKIFGNIIDFPLEDKYKRINTNSFSWTSCITTVFCHFKLNEWFLSVGFEQSEDSSILRFHSNSLHKLIGACSDVRVLLALYPPLSNGSVVQGTTDVLPLLLRIAGVPTPSNGDSRYCDKQAAALPLHSISNELWECVRNELCLSIIKHECKRQGHRCAGSEAPSYSHIVTNDDDAWISLCKLTPMLTLSLIEEDFAVVEAERLQALNVDGSGCSLEPGVSRDIRRRVAENHKHNAFLNVVRKPHINQEVLLVATQLVEDIAFCIEQIAIIEGNQSLVRKDRLEARRLLDKFNSDGDIEYLHVLKEEWADRLTAVKSQYGREIVFIDR
ncbi:PUB domain [Trypanosoma vivax]|uniref:Uncharacterized protein n=1 Tax=Trypanosoma vivax (strain Y486) TaxID=1055687 RepID=G0TSB1_TRYVY|nr:hypothetical protein TRVL_04072 [Trypanosoma vivax]KAH8605687.1 PUB domain [Trypanosoma vivax]CCC46837.1 conserved hypothetical protein [Trypanosoma vivax Y486]